MPKKKDLFGTTFHRDGSITVWDVYEQRWRRTSRPDDEILASLSVKERERVEKHISRTRDNPRSSATCIQRGKLRPHEVPADDAGGTQGGYSRCIHCGTDIYVGQGALSPIAGQAREAAAARADRRRDNPHASDYVLEDRTHANWPGLPSYRGRYAKRGYKTHEEASARAQYIHNWAAANYGASGGPDLRVIEREHERRDNPHAWSKVFG
jgi:hypothetical protein